MERRSLSGKSYRHNTEINVRSVYLCSIHFFIKLFYDIESLDRLPTCAPIQFIFTRFASMHNFPMKKTIYNRKCMQTQKLLSVDGWRYGKKPLFFLANSCAIELNVETFTEYWTITVSAWVRIQFRLLFDQSLVALVFFSIRLALSINLLWM